MSKNKKISVLVVLFIIAIALDFFYGKRNQEKDVKGSFAEIFEKNDFQKKKDWKSKLAKTEQENLQKMEISDEEGENEEDELVFRDVPIGEIGQKSLDLVRKLYQSYDDMDFFDARPAETVFAREGNPDSQSPGYYVSALRNASGEIVARAVLAVIKDNGEKVDLEAGNVEPFPPAFRDQETQEKYRQAEKYPLTDAFPRISEEKAGQIAQEKFPGGAIPSGLTSIFVELPGLDHPYQIGSWFAPYWEFSEAGNEENKVWINSESGVVIDRNHLDSEVKRFSEEMASMGE